MKATSKANGAESLKTFAIKLSPAVHEQLAAKAQQNGIPMNDLGLQLCDAFLKDRIELLVKIPVPKDIAAELAAALADPKRAEAIMRAARSQAK